MGDIVDINEQAREAAVEASKPGRFSFLDRLAGRNYPTDSVVVCLDEKAGYEIDKIEAEIAQVRHTLKVLKGEHAEEALAKVNELEAQAQDLLDLARGSLFTFSLEGISTEDYDKIVEAAQNEYPIEYRYERNPLTFKNEREVIESEERETFFRTHLWAKFIRSVEDPDGNVDDAISPEWVARVQALTPVIGQLKIAQAIDKLRMTTDWMDRIQGEDFFPKS